MKQKFDLDKEEIFTFKDNFFTDSLLNLLFYIKENPVKSIAAIIVIIIGIYFSLYLIKKPKFNIANITASQIKIERKILLVPAKNDNKQNLYPSWSPNGEKIIFISNTNNIYSICYFNSDGSGKITEILKSQKPINWITKNSIFEIKKEPVWSPDGNYIAYVSNKLGNDDIWIIKENGGEVKQLTGSELNESAPSWSPDTKKIAYQILDKGKNKISIISIDGKDSEVLISDDDSKPELSFNESAPKWSPDGKLIAYTSNQSGKYEIWLYDVLTKAKKRLTYTKGISGSPAFSPDGKKIIFLSELDNNQEIFIVNINGSELTRLTNTSEINELTCEFSPKGNEILCSYSALNSEIIEINLLLLGKD